MIYLAVIDDAVEDPVRGIRRVRRSRLLEADTLDELLASLDRWARRAYTRHFVEKVVLEPGTGVREGSVDITAKLWRNKDGKDMYTWNRIGSLEEWGDER